MKPTRKEVAKKINQEDAEKERRMKDTINRINAACSENKTALQAYVGEVRTPDGILIGTAAQVRVVLKEEPEQLDKTIEDAGNQEA